MQQAALDVFEAYRQPQSINEDGAKSISTVQNGETSQVNVYEQSGAQIRDDFNVLLLRSRVIDTSDDAGFLGIGKQLNSDATNNLSATLHAQKESFTGSRLRLIQFAGPVKRAWLDELQNLGLEIIASVANTL